MPFISFQRLSESQERKIFSSSNTIDKVKPVIASVLYECKDNIDIVDEKGELVSGSVDVTRTVQVVVHNANRTPPLWCRTDLPDMTNPYEDDPSPRCRMSCGHAITTDNLYRFCLSKLTDWANTFHCCTTRCNAEWTFQEVAEKACLSSDEHILFESRINHIHATQSINTRECPSCGMMCSRLDPSNPRVDCIYCQKLGKPRAQREFCWDCLLPWNNNHICKRNAGFQHLQRCATKEIVGVANCPSVRACPNCKTLIEHLAECKHMICSICKCEFCFICLDVKGSGGFSCGSYNTKCSVAPRQSLETLQQ
ncbi:uncharacterized protein [Argopecten irradians]|uniref:uncharacterized protein n=1 Tax=Argopecten irradians TaxID=31199 RepID=UPI003711E0A5